MERITIFKGDDTDFANNQEIAISIDTDIDITGFTAKFQFLDFTRTFSHEEVETKELSIVISAEDTAKFPIGEQFASLKLYDTNEKLKTICNRIPIEVTNRTCGVVVSDGEIKIRARMKTEWEDISGKPQIEDLPERFTDETMRDKVNELARKVSGRAITMVSVALLAFTSFCGLEVQTARKGDIFNDEPIVTNVTFTGGGGVDTNAVERIANRAVETNLVTVGLRASVSSLQSSKADKSNTYTKAETDGLLAAKLDGPTDETLSEIGRAADAMTVGLSISERVSKHGDIIDGDVTIDANLLVSGTITSDIEIESGNNQLTKKANRPDPVPLQAGNLASLTETGDLADSGVRTDEYGNIDLYTDGSSLDAFTVRSTQYDVPQGYFNPPDFPAGGKFYGTLKIDDEDVATKAMISADDETFSAAVLGVGLNIDAETLQWLKDIGAIAGTTTGKVGIGTLLAALLAALMWLKTNKADKSELPYMVDKGDGRYEYTGALADASSNTYPREVA